jgi:putative DNA primase/helicase
MREKITERARGHWRGILIALGIASKLVDKKHHPCPFCGGRDRFRFVDYDGTGGYICSRCGNGSGFDLLMKVKGWDFKTAAREVERVIGACAPDAEAPERTEAEKRAAMNKLWRAAKPVTDRDPVGLYLGVRCGIREFPAVLRHVPALHYTGATTDYHAMIAKLTAPNGKPSNIHRTYLTEDGRKAPVESPRRMMPGAVAKGSAVRLAAPAAAMGIAEGIETALSAAVLFGIPTWAALTAALLRSWQPPEGVEHVTIFGDNDENFTGHEVSYALAKRLSIDRIEVSIEIPPTIGDDWNDVHRRVRAQTCEPTRDSCGEQ